MLGIGDGMALIGAGIAIFGGAVGTSMAQSTIGGAIVGVLGERPEEPGKMLIWLVIPETIIIFSFVVAVLAIFKVV
ncbi:MAG: ATPase [Candidatus ainarchaeum sp.]|nr:ATPase [Candidatus ainarchaeum sp.]